MSVRRVALVLLAAAVAALCAAAPAAAKSFSIDDVSVVSRIQPDGDLVVRESRTVTFGGAFSYVYWDYLTAGSEGIVVRGASGPEGPYERTGDTFGPAPGTYSVTDYGDRVRVQLNFALADTAATFSVEYVARGAATRWADTAELYWQFLGDETAVETEAVRVAVQPPAGVTKGEVRAWAHGPLYGEVMIRDDASVLLSVAPLPASTFVEARILFPADALPGATQLSQPRLQQVLAQEQELADQANRDRLWARVRVGLWGLLGVVVPLAALVLALVLYVRHGREPKTAFQAQYLRDFPDPRLAPALVSYIWEMGSVDNDAAMATLLDLIDRGVVAIEREVRHKDGLFGGRDETDYRLTLRRDHMSGLEPFERALLDFLFDDIADGDSFAMDELRDVAKDKRVEWVKGYGLWKKGVEGAGEQRGFLDATADRMAFWTVTIGFVAAVAAGAAAIFSQFYWFFLGIAPALVAILVSHSVKRRSQEAAELHAQYAAIRRYLKDFGRLDEKPPDAVVLWQHFLVLAVVFGMADEVVEHLQVKVPEVVRDPAFHTMAFMMVAPDGGGRSGFAAMSGGFAAAVSVATSSSSSGSGGGGGFSGGGGGGGGGGGFGAG
jgi:uncharacterized membrane protein